MKYETELHFGLKISKKPLDKNTIHIATSNTICESENESFYIRINSF